jgi:hypothetical protein
MSFFFSSIFHNSGVGDIGKWPSFARCCVSSSQKNKKKGFEWGMSKLKKKMNGETAGMEGTGSREAAERCCYECEGGLGPDCLNQIKKFLPLPNNSTSNMNV